MDDVVQDVDYDDDMDAADDDDECRLIVMMMASMMRLMRMCMMNDENKHTFQPNSYACG